MSKQEFIRTPSILILVAVLLVVVPSAGRAGGMPDPESITGEIWNTIKGP